MIDRDDYETILARLRADFKSAGRALERGMGELRKLEEDLRD